MYPFFFSLLPILYPHTLPGTAPVSLDGTQREDTPPCLMVTWILLSCFVTERCLHGSKKDVGGKLSVGESLTPGQVSAWSVEGWWLPWVPWPVGHRRRVSHGTGRGISEDRLGGRCVGPFSPGW